MWPSRRWLLLALAAIGGCRNGASDQQGGNDLSAMRTAVVSIGSGNYEVWVAETETQREQGLMFVQSEQLQPLPDGTERGMLFVFDKESILSFWMKNTFIPLDIAYARSDGTIVKIYTMTPLDTTPFKYVSRRPARFALEVRANLLAEKGVREGDTLQIPPEVLNPGG